MSGLKFCRVCVDRRSVRMMRPIPASGKKKAGWICRDCDEHAPEELRTERGNVSAQKRERILFLRRSGLKYEAISKAVGVDKCACARIVRESEEKESGK